MLGDAWQAWWVVLSGTAVAVLVGILAQAILTQEARAFMPISALGGLAFLVLLGCIILFQGRPLCWGQADVMRHTACLALRQRNMPNCASAGGRLFTFLVMEAAFGGLHRAAGVHQPSQGQLHRRC